MLELLYILLGTPGITTRTALLQVNDFRFCNHGPFCSMLEINDIILYCIIICHASKMNLFISLTRRVTVHLTFFVRRWR